MYQNDEVSPINYDDLKRRIAEEMRAVLRELATEKGLSYDEYVEYLIHRRRA
jgi:hypothetical protein